MGSWMKPTNKWETVYREWAAYRQWAADQRWVPYRQWAAYRHWVQIKLMKEAHLVRRKKTIYGAEQLHYPSPSTEEMLSTTEHNLPRIWSILQLRLSTKTKNSPIESHLSRRIIAQRKVHFSQGTSIETLLECSTIYKSNAPNKLTSYKW